MVVQLKSSIKSADHNVAFYEASEDELEKELAATINDSTWPSQFTGDIHVELVDLREGFRARNSVIWSIFKG